MILFPTIRVIYKEIGYGDQSINKKMKDYINLFHSIVSDIHFWKNTLKLIRKISYLIF